MHKLLNFIRLGWIAITVVMLAGITALCLLPSAGLPSAPGTDKSHHFLAYAVLVLPTALRKPKKWMLFGLFFIAYSGVIELIQARVGRSGEWADLLANTLGVVAGFGVAMLVNYFCPAKRGKTDND
ncbi:MAG: VanZ family protein [Phycisphaerales bacterium]|nr:VanZ family protein [Phycisphaerales bacterium]